MIGAEQITELGQARQQAVSKFKSLSAHLQGILFTVANSKGMYEDLPVVQHVDF